MINTGTEKTRRLIWEKIKRKLTRKFKKIDHHEGSTTREKLENQMDTNT